VTLTSAEFHSAIERRGVDEETGHHSNAHDEAHGDSVVGHVDDLAVERLYKRDLELGDMLPK
jgi:hypothetical protein